MKKPYLIITNNPKVADKYGGMFWVEYREDDYRSVLIRVRDAVHAGHRLLTHPLAGSLKPNQTPFRSVMLTKGAEGTDWADLERVESSLDAYHKFTQGRKTPIWTERVRDDFATIDLSLIDGAAGNPAVARS